MLLGRTRPGWCHSGRISTTAPRRKCDCGHINPQHDRKSTSRWRSNPTRIGSVYRIHRFVVFCVRLDHFRARSRSALMGMAVHSRPAIRNSTSAGRNPHTAEIKQRRMLREDLQGESDCVRPCLHIRIRALGHDLMKNPHAVRTPGGPE